MTGQQPPASGHQDDAAQQETAAEIRRQWPRWVVIWVPRKSEFQARPCFGGRWRDTVAAGATRQELTARMAGIRPGASSATGRQA